MNDGRKTFVWRITKLSAIIAIPFSTVMFFYSTQIMQLFGDEYGQGALFLQIMVLATLPSQIASGVSTLSYSYGKYKQVLGITVAGNLARVVLFLALTPAYGATGAALSYTLGAVASLIVSVIVSKKIGLNIFWKVILLTFAVPFALAYLLSYFEVPFILAIIISVLGSYLSFLRLHVLTKADIEDSIEVLPSTVAKSTLNMINRIGKRLDPSY
ncbi:MAG: polysaccharide biosynthesis C-terminal domain-containing protein [Nitrososphaera sp.]